ncbi:cyclase [Streptomyces sp. NPDC090026]|uniref:cyclase n=1 Tax=Streptomyces sp. NPDC090026 TaxID=3365923 RepID=UPI0037F8A3EC
MGLRSALSRVPATAAGALALAGLAAAPASAAGTVVGLDCQAKPPVGSAQTFDLDAEVEATAPVSVASGDSFTITLATQQMTVPSSVGGYTVKSLKSIKLTAPVPENAALNGVTLSGGSGTGPGEPTVSVGGGTIVLTVPGPINGGADFTLPALTLDLTAGPSGGTVETRLSGTGYNDPGLTFTASVPILFVTVNVPTSCYPSPNPVLSSTSIT